VCVVVLILGHAVQARGAMSKSKTEVAKAEYLRLLPTLGKCAAANKAGLSMTHIYRLRQSSEGFRLEEDQALGERVDRVEQALEDIALGHEEGSAVQVNAARLVLQANRQKYQPQTHTQITGPGGGPLQIARVDEELVREAVKQIEQRMRALPGGTDDEPTTAQ